MFDDEFWEQEPDMDLISEMISAPKLCMRYLNTLKKPFDKKDILTMIYIKETCTQQNVGPMALDMSMVILNHIQPFYANEGVYVHVKNYYSDGYDMEESKRAYGGYYPLSETGKLMNLLYDNISNITKDDSYGYGDNLELYYDFTVDDWYIELKTYNDQELRRNNQSIHVYHKPSFELLNKRTNEGSPLEHIANIRSFCGLPY